MRRQTPGFTLGPGLSLGCAASGRSFNPSTLHVLIPEMGENNSVCFTGLLHRLADTLLSAQH